MSVLKNLRTLARYNVLTPIAVLGALAASPVMAQTLTIPAPVLDGVYLPDYDGQSWDALINNSTIQNNPLQTAVFSDETVTFITNSAGASIMGDSANALGFDEMVGTFTNNGTILNFGAFGGSAIYFDSSVTTFINTDSITSTVDSAVNFNGTVGSFSNSGTIEGIRYSAVGFNETVGSFTNTATGIIRNTNGTGLEDPDDSSAAIQFNGNVTSFLNMGTIEGAPESAFDARGVAFYGGSAPTTFVNGGDITGIDGAVTIDGMVTSFSNIAGGLLSSDGNQTTLYFGGGVGSFTNALGARIENNDDGEAIIFNVNSEMFGDQDIGGAVGTFNNAGEIFSAGKNAVAFYTHGSNVAFGLTSFTNSGSIISEDERAVQIDSAVGSFVNTGTIEGYDRAIQFNGRVDSFNNSNRIFSDDEDGVWFNKKVGSFANLAGGLIEADEHGVRFQDTVDSFVNAGRIKTDDNNAVRFTGLVTSFQQLAGGEIEGHNSGVVIQAGVTTFTNAGLIVGNENAGVAIDNGGAGTFLNLASGRIVSHDEDDAVRINGTVGLFNNAGEINGDDRGAYFEDLVTSFANSGTIIARGTALQFESGVTNGSNSSTIKSTAGSNQNGVFIGSGATVTSFTNTGLIEGAGGFTTNTNFNGRHTFINAGTVRATSSDEYAVDFRNNSNDTLRLLTGSEIYGSIEFGTSGVDSGIDTLDFSGFYGTAVLDVVNLNEDDFIPDFTIAGDRAWADVGAGPKGRLIAIYDPTGATTVGGTTASDSLGAIRDVIGGQLGGATGVSSTVIENAYAAGPDLGDAANASAVMSELDVGLTAPFVDTRV